MMALIRNQATTRLIRVHRLWLSYLLPQKYITWQPTRTAKNGPFGRLQLHQFTKPSFHSDQQQQRSTSLHEPLLVRLHPNHQQRKPLAFITPISRTTSSPLRLRKSQLRRTRKLDESRVAGHARRRPVGEPTKLNFLGTLILHPEGFN